MKNLILNSLLTASLLVSSCSVSVLNGYNSTGNAGEVLPVSWFHADTGYFLFNTTIDILKNHYSGILVIKPTDDGSERVVFMTEVGLKVFDLEFYSDGHMQVHYIMEAIDKKTLIKTLSNDFSIILMNRLANIQPKAYSAKESMDEMIMYRWEGRRTYYHFSGQGQRPDKVLQTKCLGNKVQADFYGNDVSGIDSVLMSHFNLKLQINLYRIKD